MRISDLFRRREIDQRVDEEFEFHLRMQIEENIRSGMNASDACVAARRKLGNRTQVTEEVYRMNTISFLEEVAQNVRFSVRTLRRNPGFAMTAVLVLALGLGSSTAMFSALDRILFRPLPYADEDRLVHFGMTFPSFSGRGAADSDLILIAGSYQGSWKPVPEPFTAVTTVMWGKGSSCDVTEQPSERLLCAQVESNFLKTFGVRPVLGRDFTPEDDVRGAPQVAIISHKVWTRRFGADPGAIGRTMDLDGASASVIGVLPAEFSMPTGEADILRPQQQYPLPPGQLGSMLTAFGRLKPGVTGEQARAAIAPIIEANAKELPRVGGNSPQPRVVRLRDHLIGDAPRVAWLLLGAVAGLLLIACVNVTNLIVARLAARNREFEVRAALGAGRARLARLALTESLMLAVVGGTLGLALAAGMLRMFVQMAPSSMREIERAALDLRVFAVAGALALVAGLAVGAWPAFSVWRVRELQHGSRATPAARPRMRFALVTAQIALTVVMLGGSALLLRTLWNQVAVPLGYQSEQVFTMRVEPNAARYPPSSRGSRHALFEQLLDRIRQIPGTVAATMSSDEFPSGRHSVASRIAVDRQPPRDLPPGMRLRGQEVTPGYFQTFRIPILKGRAFAESDRDGPPVAILSESAARLLFPGQDPIGHTVERGYNNTDLTRVTRWAEVVGVAGDVRNVGPTLDSDPEIYVPAENWGYLASYAVYAIRTQASSVDAAAFMKQAVADLDPLTPVTVEPLDAEVDRQTERPRFVAWLLAAFAGLALLLAAAGLYGVASYLVTQRTRDIGVRMALGASPADISRQVMGEAGRWIAAGAVLGCALAYVAIRAIEAQLYGVGSLDPLSWIAALGVLCGALFLAVWRPASRAARVDPMEALRAD